MGAINARGEMETRTVLPGAHNNGHSEDNNAAVTVSSFILSATFNKRMYVDCAVSQALVLGLHKL
jgi:hypothetical protein